MSNRAKEQDDLQRLREELQQKDQIIDRLTRLLAQPADAPPLKQAVNEEKVVPIDIARRARRR